MTIIVWDGKKLAHDGNVTNHASKAIDRDCVKVIAGGPLQMAGEPIAWIGFAGSLQVLKALQDALDHASEPVLISEFLEGAYIPHRWPNGWSLLCITVSGKAYRLGAAGRKYDTKGAITGKVNGTEISDDQLPYVVGSGKPKANRLKGLKLGAPATCLVIATLDNDHCGGVVRYMQPGWTESRVKYHLTPTEHKKFTKWLDATLLPPTEKGK